MREQDDSSLTSSDSIISSPVRANMSRGNEETKKLKANVEDQLNRLLTQLQDLEDLKDELDPEEYKQTKEDTIAQLKEFRLSLQKVHSCVTPFLVMSQKKKKPTAIRFNILKYV